MIEVVLSVDLSLAYRKIFLLSSYIKFHLTTQPFLFIG